MVVCVFVFCFMHALENDSSLHFLVKKGNCIYLYDARGKGCIISSVIIYTRKNIGSTHISKKNVQDFMDA